VKINCRAQLTSRSSRQLYAPQWFVHALRALLHKPLFRYALRLNSSVSANQKIKRQNPIRSVQLVQNIALARNVLDLAGKAS